MLWFGNSDKRSVALIDISSGSVAGSFLHIAQGKPPTLIFSVREHVEERAEGEVGMLRALDSVVHALTTATPLLRTKTGSGSVSRAYVTVGEPWLHTEIHTESVKKESPFVLTQDFIDSLLKTKDDKKILQSTKLLSALLNGYLVEEPVGKKVKEAELSILVTRIDKEVNDHLIKGLHRIAHDISLVGHTPLLKELAGRIFPQQKDFITLLVSEETAEIGMVKQGTLQKTTVLPQGTEVFARAARQGGFSSYAEGGALIDTGRNDRLAKAIEDAEKSWLIAFVESLRGLVDHQALPQNVFLVADLNSRDFMRRLLGADEIKQLWLSGEKATVVPILPQHLTPTLHLEENVNSDIVLEALALYAVKTP